MSKEIEDEISQAVKVTDYFVSLPSLIKQYIFLIILMGIFTLILSKLLLCSMVEALLSSFLLLTVPTVISALTLRIVRKIPLKRAFFLMLFICIIYMLVYSVYFLTNDVNYLILGFSAIFILLFLIMYYILYLRYTAFVFSLAQLFFFIVMFYYVIFNISITNSSFPDVINVLITKLFITSVIFSGFIYFLFYIINAPVKKAFSVSGTRAFSLFMSQWLDDSKELEKEFEKVGIFMRSYVDVLLFKNSKGNCLITIPQVHFGPFGNLGGSDYPNLMSQIFEKHVDCSIVFHGACTHDQNPTSSSRIKEITEPVLSFINENKNLYTSKVGFVSCKYKETKSSHLFFDDALLSSFSRFPHTTEDMEYGLGLLLREKGMRYREKSFIVDEHNSDTGKITHFLLGSNEASEYLNSMDCLREEIKKVKMKKVKFNFIKLHKPYFPTAGISNNGIGMFCFVSKTRSILYVVIDSNSVNNEVKLSIENKLKGLFDEVVINTTDSHSLNKVSGVINPATVKEIDILLNDLMLSAKEMKSNASDFTMVSETIPINIKVFGPHQSLKLIGVVNSLISILKFVVPFLFLFGILFALYILSLL